MGNARANIRHHSIQRGTSGIDNYVNRFVLYLIKPKTTHLAELAIIIRQIKGFGLLGGRFLEGAARQPEMANMLQVKLFIVGVA